MGRLILNIGQNASFENQCSLDLPSCDPTFRVSLLEATSCLLDILIQNGVFRGHALDHQEKGKTYHKEDQYGTDRPIQAVVLRGDGIKPMVEIPVVHPE